MIIRDGFEYCGRVLQENLMPGSVIQSLVTGNTVIVDGYYGLYNDRKYKVLKQVSGPKFIRSQIPALAQADRLNRGLESWYDIAYNATQPFGGYAVVE